MKITQISIFLENRKGRLSQVCSLLGDNNINILALTVADSEDFGILRAVVDKPEKAVKLLKENSFAASLTDVVIVEVDDKPGGLANLLKKIEDCDINIEYMHAFMSKTKTSAYMVFRFDDPDQAIKKLEENSVRVIKENELHEI